MIVEKLEEMMARGEGWPFVTHFVGCKPCGKDGSGTYAMEQCLQHMDRAYNFADNQILKLYGYRHTTLNTHAVQRVRMETSDSLDLIHGST
jgi:xyloglucan 6-xylosyltransferase